MRVGEIEPPRIEVISDPLKTRRVYLDIIDRARSEIMLLLPSVMAFYRQERLGVMTRLEEAAQQRGVRVRILTVTDSYIEKKIAKDQADFGSQLLFQPIMPSIKEKSIMVLIADRRISFIIEKEDDSQEDFVRATDFATYSNGEASVHANILFFETLWNASELLEKEVRNRSQAQSRGAASAEAWEITPASFRCVRCGKKVEHEIRIYDPRLMPTQSEAASSAMETHNAGWIPFCFECISTHPLLRPSWLSRQGSHKHSTP
jgi:hypothetical protein